MKKKLLVSLSVSILCLCLAGCDKRMNQLENISIVIKEDTLTNTSATIIITDLSGNQNTYGEWFRIDKKEYGKWKEVKKIGEAWFVLIGYMVDENYQLELEQNWKDIYGKLEPGKYRLVKEVNNEYISVEFKID